MLERFWKIAVILPALSFMLMLSEANAQIVTTKTPLSNTSYTDLGVGPLLLWASGNSIIYQVADPGYQPSTSSTGINLPLGAPPATINTTSHVWAIAASSLTTAAVTYPINPSAGGGGAVTAASGSYVDGALVTLGTLADSAYAGSGSASAIAALKGIYAKLTASLPLPTGAATSALQTALNTAIGSPFQAGGSIGNTSFGSSSSPIITNPTSTLTLTSSTTAYAAGQLIANSATAGSIVVPSFAISNAAGGALIPRLRLSTNDTTSTAWGSVSIQIDLWAAAPTWTNGDRGAWSPATGTGSHLSAYSCTMSAEYGDGAYAECAPSVGSAALPKLASGTSVYWTLEAVTASGVTGASKVWTLTAELLN